VGPTCKGHLQPSSLSASSSPMSYPGDQQRWWHLVGRHATAGRQAAGGQAVGEFRKTHHPRNVAV
jgi:hypothetical protein